MDGSSSNSYYLSKAFNQMGLNWWPVVWDWSKQNGRSCTQYFLQLYITIVSTRILNLEASHSQKYHLSKEIIFHQFAVKVTNNGKHIALLIKQVLNSPQGCWYLHASGGSCWGLSLGRWLIKFYNLISFIIFSHGKLRVVRKFWSRWLSCQSKQPVQRYFI